jgi:hypothetical protein
MFGYECCGSATIHAGPYAMILQILSANGQPLVNVPVQALTGASIIGGSPEGAASFTLDRQAYTTDDYGFIYPQATPIDADIPACPCTAPKGTQSITQSLGVAQFYVSGYSPEAGYATAILSPTGIFNFTEPYGWPACPSC